MEKQLNFERTEEWFQLPKERAGDGGQSANGDGEPTDSADTESEGIETMV